MTVTPPRKKILQDLYSGPVSFSFEKKDGSLREMTATLLYRLIPEDKKPELMENDGDPANDLVKCYDLEAKGWRSFHISSLKTYKDQTL